MKRLVAAFVSILLLGSVTETFAQSADSIAASLPETPQQYEFKPRKLIAPLALTAAGAVGIECFKGLKRGLNSDFSRWRGDNYWHGDDYLQYVPATAYLGLGLCGVDSRSNLRDRVMIGATSYICMAALVNLTKALVEEKRPDSNAVNSFPSGHSATVFLGAELMRIEYGNLVGTAGYAVAVGVGFLRMYNNRHWYNDVLAGAGIGILCARLGYWLLPLEKRLFKISDNSTTALAVPYVDPATRACGVSFALSL